MEGFNYPETVQQNLNLYILFWLAYKNTRDLVESPYIHPEIQSNKLHIIFTEFKDC